MANAVCIDFSESIELVGSYTVTNLAQFVRLQINACTSDTKCETPEKIEEFLKSNIFAMQSPNVEFAYEDFGSDENYMPIETDPIYLYWGSF